LPIPQNPSKALTLQLTEDVTVILTGHNAVNDEPSDVYMTTVELSNVEIFENQSPEVKFSEIQLPEVKFSEIQLPEAKFPEIQFPSLEPIFKFIAEYYIIFIIGLLIIVISFIPQLFIGFLRLLGFSISGISKNSLIAKCQSITTKDVGGLRLLQVIVMAISFVILFFYLWAKGNQI
ncbi:9554_t:CDS:1, partial [Cetraspora pellucida]